MAAGKIEGGWNPLGDGYIFRGEKQVETFCDFAFYWEQFGLKSEGAITFMHDKKKRQNKQKQNKTFIKKKDNQMTYKQIKTWQESTQ